MTEGKYGLTLRRENYAIISNKNSLPKFSLDIYADDEGKTYTEAWCKKQLEDCLTNYDLNMEYFSLLDYSIFNNEMNKFLQKNKKFCNIIDLNDYEGISGYYIMVLDKYCQVYIGTSQDIKNRIKSHWTTRKSFDRLLFPMSAVSTSLISIDSFRALDTTRIFVHQTSKIYEIENNYINQFSPEFVSNRMAGGVITGGLLQAIGMMKIRKLTK